MLSLCPGFANCKWGVEVAERAVADITAEGRHAAGVAAAAGRAVEAGQVRANTVIVAAATAMSHRTATSAYRRKSKRPQHIREAKRLRRRARTRTRKERRERNGRKDDGGCALESVASADVSIEWPVVDAGKMQLSPSLSEVVACELHVRAQFQRCCSR
mmetsp:Transcript_16447/g.37935  ORF Transcript_16447/g.37935 Transcript_16447/m.37935 type:complete len:159 (+) Transcript_16447:798-1274(+)